jgi:hypothetical protein
MTDQKTYWLADALGNRALVTGAAERDRWVPLGWYEVDEPTGNELVHAWHAGIDVPALQPARALRDVWGPRGWEPGPPPVPVSAFNADQTDVTRPAVADDPAPISKPAAGGVVKKES